MRTISAAPITDDEVMVLDRAAAGRPRDRVQIGLEVVAVEETFREVRLRVVVAVHQARDHELARGVDAARVVVLDRCPARRCRRSRRRRRGCRRARSRNPAAARGRRGSAACRSPVAVSPYDNRPPRSVPPHGAPSARDVIKRHPMRLRPLRRRPALWFALLAAVLNALTPLAAYARSGAIALPMELCSAATPAGSGDAIEVPVPGAPAEHATHHPHCGACPAGGLSLPAFDGAGCARRVRTGRQHRLPPARSRAHPKLSLPPVPTARSARAPAQLDHGAPRRPPQGIRSRAAPIRRTRS